MKQATTLPLEVFVFGSVPVSPPRSSAILWKDCLIPEQADPSFDTHLALTVFYKPSINQVLILLYSSLKACYNLVDTKRPKNLKQVELDVFRYAWEFGHLVQGCPPLVDCSRYQ